MHIRSENVSKTQKLVMVLNYVIRVDDADVKLAANKITTLVPPRHMIHSSDFDTDWC